MKSLSVSNIAALAGGTLVAASGDALILRVVTDSRQVKPGDLFVALRGDRFDAHQFLDQVVAQGATAVLVDQVYASQTAVIQVSNTLSALQLLAKNYRSSLATQVIGITGSNGKTSTKDLTAAVFSSSYSVTKTTGNLNNHIGLPLSVLEIDDTHQFAILEMGMNHPGEIAPLAGIAQANAAIITNIGVAHIEYMGSQEAIAQEKGMLAESIPATGTVILNANDPFSPGIAQRSIGKILIAGIDKGDIFASQLRPAAGGTHFLVSYQNTTSEAWLPVSGRHMVGNALLAIAAGVSFGIPLRQAVASLGNLRLTGGRLETRQLGDYTLIDDTYNANPDSMVAALRTLNDLPVIGRRIAVLGAMGELGTYAEEGHRRVGAAASGIDLLITVGTTARWIAEAAAEHQTIEIIQVATTGEAAQILAQRLLPNDTILCKGSRSARMEHVFAELEHHILSSSV